MLMDFLSNANEYFVLIKEIFVDAYLPYLCEVFSNYRIWLGLVAIALIIVFGIAPSVKDIINYDFEYPNGNGNIDDMEESEESNFKDEIWDFGKLEDYNPLIPFEQQLDDEE